MAVKISIIVVSYNTRDITDKCLASVKESADFLHKKTGDQVETIVVDNLSTDGSREMISTKHPWVSLILPKSNTGFSGGNNLGMKKAAGDYILILNSDAFLQKETLFKSLEYLESNPKCDVLGCKLYYSDGRYQPSAGYLPNPVNTFLWVWGVDVLPVFKNLIPSVHLKNEIQNTRKVGWIMGAFMFLKREVWEKTKGLDENFFMYMEDVEWCKRIQQEGFNIWYVPSFSIVHLHGASSSYDMEGPMTKEMLGLVYYFKKHYSFMAWFMKFVLWWGNVARIIAFTVVGRKDRAEVYKKIIKLI